MRLKIRYGRIKPKLDNKFHQKIYNYNIQLKENGKMLEECYSINLIPKRWKYCKKALCIAPLAKISSQM
jgi:hypothetical protein